jgi:hypothetical protein
LRQAKYFTKIDLRGAYNLLRIAEGEEWKTAFRTRYGLFEYLVMPFGLTNAPASFQHLMNHNFRTMLDHYVICYLDDILIYSDTLEEHYQHVTSVLETLRKAGLFAKAEKCEFHQHSVEFLGFIVGRDGITMDVKKVQSILDWPTPTNLFEVRSFLGFCNFYRRFIASYSSIAHPLTQLTREDTPFLWTDKHTQAFNKLKNAFTSATLLAHFNPEKPLVLETDASDFALAGILSQESEEGILKPIAFFSRKMVPAELNYEIHDKEMLAIISCFKEWRQYLEGTFTEVLTDHKSLEYFTTTKQLNRRQGRWSQFLQDFHFIIKYRPGSQGTKPDALTRRPDLHPMTKGSSLSPEANPDNHQALLKPGQFLFATGSSELLPQSQQDIITALQEETFAQDVITSLDKHPGYTLQDQLLLYKGRTYLPDKKDLRLRITREHHDSLQHGHPGQRKTLQLVQRNYWWPKMKEFIHSYVDSCDACQRNKSQRHKPYGELKSLPIPPYPWSNISMDLIEDLPRSDGYNSILVIVD